MILERLFTAAGQGQSLRATKACVSCRRACRGFDEPFFVVGKYSEENNHGNQDLHFVRFVYFWKATA